MNIALGIYIKKEMTRDVDRYLGESGQLRSVVHLVFPSLPAAVHCGLLFNTKFSLHFLCFHANSKHWVWVSFSPVLPVFACFLFPPIVVNKNFFKKNLLFSICLTCLFYYVRGEGGKVLLEHKNVYLPSV